MKQIRPILCAALIALSMSGEAQAAMWFQAKGAIAHDQRVRDRNDSQSNSGNDNRRSGGGDDRWGGGSGWDEDRSNNRAGRAKSAVSNKGRVLDVGQENGSIFWVVVSTDHGRVTYLVNTDTGRVVGER